MALHQFSLAISYEFSPEVLDEALETDTDAPFATLTQPDGALSSMSLSAASVGMLRHPIIRISAKIALRIRIVVIFTIILLPFSKVICKLYHTAKHLSSTRIPLLT